MPLIKSGSRAAISQNISEMVHAGHPQDQAVAAAMRNAREYGAHKAAGGFTAPMGERMAARNITSQGFLHSAVPGRTDKLPITVGGGSYVLPADHVAALGQNNSIAGAHVVNKMFGMGPFGTPAQPMHAGHAPQPPRMNLKGRADGGASHAGQPTPIIAAGGEMIIPPDKIIAKFGSLEKGHQALDKWVLNTRAKHIATLKTLKPPKKD